MRQKDWSNWSEHWAWLVLDDGNGTGNPGPSPLQRLRLRRLPSPLRLHPSGGPAMLIRYVFIPSDMIDVGSLWGYQYRSSTSKNNCYLYEGRQGRTKLTFKLDFPGNLWLAAFAILAMFFNWRTRLLCLLKKKPRPAMCKDSNNFSSKSWKTRSLRSLFHSFSDQAERRSKYIFGDDS